jgi:succinyl-diaminopimelate desuccinylase
VALMAVGDFLQAILRIESRSGSEGALAARVVQEMQNLGFDAAWTDTRGNAFGVVKGLEAGAAVMLMTHLDHIDVGDLSLWQHPPFAGVLEDGVFHGRGAVDIKGPLAAQVHTLGEMLARGQRPKRHVIVAAPVMEEIGGEGIAFVMDHLPLETPLGTLEIGACIVGEPSGNRVMLGHRGVCRCTLSFHGRAHHASLGLKTENPHFALAHFLHRLETFQPATHPILGSSTLTPTVIHADTASNNLTPNRIDLTLDWRTTTETGADVKRILETLLEGLNASFVSFDDWHSGEGGIKHPGFVIEPTHPLVLNLQRVVSDTIPETLEPGIWRFATDGRFTHARGIPTIGFGPGDEGLAHTTRERIGLLEIERHMRALETFLVDAEG